MSHIHLPDGILPVWLWVLGYALSALLIAVFWRRERAATDPKRFALLGIFSAIMILIMSIEIPPFGFHFNLSVVTGIILGPQLAVVAALIVNLILAFLGHGGVTVVGLNTLTVSTEMIIGCYVFRLLHRLRLPIGYSGFIAVMIGLLCGTGVSFGIISAGSPWINSSLQQANAEAGEYLSGGHIALGRLAIIMFGLGTIGWILEGLLSAAILSYLARIRPGLVTKGEE